jgi:hypothetical protein
MYLTHFSFVCVLLINMYHFLNKRQNQNLLKSRFNIEAPEPFYILKTGQLSTLPCRDLYAALSFAITGTTEFRHEFCHEILHFLKHSWSNRVMYDKLEEEENVCIASYVDEQLRHFDPCPLPPFLEVKAAATFLQLKIHVIIPSQSTVTPALTFCPLVDTLKRGKFDEYTYDGETTICIAANDLGNGRYTFGIVSAFPFRLNGSPSQNSKTVPDSSTFYFQREVFINNIDTTNIEHVCELIGYPRHNYFAKLRRGMAEPEIFHEIFSEWYQEAKPICKQNKMKPFVILGRAYMILGKHEAIELTVSSEALRHFIRSYNHKLCDVVKQISNCFVNVVKPIRK